MNAGSEDVPELQAPLKRPTYCAIYTRQSTDAVDDLSSCAVQREACTAFVGAHRTEGWVVVGESFDDEGYSGADLDRPALQNLLTWVQTGVLSRILVHRLDRLSRNVRECVGLFQEFRDHGVDLIVVTAPELGLAAQDTLILNVLASFAEFERELTSSRIAESRARLKAMGRRVAGAIPFGYDADGRTRQLVPDPNEAEKVQWMFAEAAGGQTPTAIAREANARGWRTKVRPSKRSGGSTGGNPWTARQVLATLSNPIYAGQIADDSGWRTGCHEPLITEDLFAAVRAEREQRRTRRPGRELRVIPWRLKGKIRCGACGRVMSTHTVRSGARIYRYYRCRSTAGGRQPCRNSQVSTGDLELGLVSFFTDLRNPPRIRPLLTRSGRRALRNLSAHFVGLSLDQRDFILQAAIEEITYDPETGAASVVFNESEIRRQSDMLSRDAERVASSARAVRVDGRALSNS